MERVSSAVRLDLRPGEWVLWKARPFRFVSLQGSTASIRDSVNAELHEVAVADLRGMPSLPPEDLDQRVDRLRTTSDQSWCLAQQRESIIRELLNREGSMAERLATTPKAAAANLLFEPSRIRQSKLDPIADIALYGYTHCATDGGIDLAAYPAVGAWLKRVASEPRPCVA